MVQQLKNRSKIGKYSATMYDSMKDTANSLAGTNLAWIDGKWQGTKGAKVTDTAMKEFTRILGLLENRTAKYLAQGDDELEAVGKAKADLQDEGKITQNLAAMQTQSPRIPPPLPTVGTPAVSTSPTRIPTTQ